MLGGHPELEQYVDPLRAARAHRAEAELARFCERLGLAVDHAAVTLFVTSLVDAQSPSGRSVRTRVQLLDLAARLRGQEPWTADPDLRRFLRGIHKELPLGGGPRSDPLYRELVEALVDAVMAPTYGQVQAVAAVLVASETGLSTSTLMSLRWRDVIVERDCVIVRPPRAARCDQRPNPDWSTIPIRYRHAELAGALRQLRALCGSADSAVFASEWGAIYRNKLDLCLKPLRREQGRRGDRSPVRGRALARLLNLARDPAARQLRDRAVILIAFGAALRGYEAIALERSAVQSVTRGLVLHLRNRSGPVGIESSHDRFCPVAAWQAWDGARQVEVAPAEEARAFPQMSGSKVWAGAATASALNEIVHMRSRDARLMGMYTFSSLRTGYIRTALRAGVSAHEVARHADLASLTSIRRHEMRENLLRDNIAGRIGL